MSDYKIRKWLEKLAEKNLVQKIGSGPATRYIIRETYDEKITQLQIALDNLNGKKSAVNSQQSAVALSGLLTQNNDSKIMIKHMQERETQLLSEEKTVRWLCEKYSMDRKESC